jgi:aspartate kinase
MIVLKFGGTSVRDAEAFKRVYDIVVNTHDTSYISGPNETKLVVLSASSGITDSLIALVNAAVGNDANKVSEIYSKIYDRQFEIINGLIPKDSPQFINCNSKVRLLLDELKSFIEGISFFGEASARALDKAMSFGELLSTTIFHYFLLTCGISNNWLDARENLKTDSSFGEAIVNYAISQKNSSEICQNNLILGEKIAVTQGFIGSDYENHTTTLGRGGSDFSAAIFGKLFNADEIQIWTDVDGVLSADPRVVQPTITISEMAFDEVRALAYLGAKVLHPQTLIPAIEANIPVLVLNSMNKEHSGTKIIRAIESEEIKLHSVLKINAVRVSFNLANVEKIIDKANEILSVFSKNSVKIYSASLLPDALIIWFDKSSDFQSDLEELFNHDYELESSKSLVGIVGLNLDKYNLENLNFQETHFDFVSANESKNTILIAVREEESGKILEGINMRIVGEQLAV